MSRSEQSDSAGSEAPCVHCGLPTITSADEDPKTVFCCNGCRQAHELIHGWGLDDYYDIRDQVGGQGNSIGNSEAAYECFDDDAFLGRCLPQPLGDGSVRTELSVSGLHCAACAWLIENVANRTAGWHLARVKLNRHTLQVVFDPSRIALSQIAQTVGRLGYRLAPLGDGDDDSFARENRRLLMQIAVAGFCAANAMWIAIALYAGELAVASGAAGVAAEYRSLFRVAGTVLGVGAVVFPGRTFFVSAIAALRSRTPHMDLPVALGLGVGTIVGVLGVLMNRGDVYFDSLTMLVFLLLIGRWIQFRQQHRAASAVDLLLRITPQHARLVREKSEKGRLVLAESLSPGQWIRVGAGESVPVDGAIVDGHTTLDRSLMTGESVPIEAVQGDEVAAGTTNLSRPIVVSVTATGADSRIGKVMHSVESAMSQRTPIVQLADSIGGFFVIAVTALAAVAFFAWLPISLARATANATSLLIVACPCALALATPLAIAVTLGRAAKRRILIRDGDVLQRMGLLKRLGNRGILWFDKTGTLTEGRPRAELVFGDPAAVKLASVLESDVLHPIADAIVSLGRELGALEQRDTVDLDCELVSGGLVGHVEGSSLVIGNESLHQERGSLFSDASRESIEDCLAGGATPIVIAVDRAVAAVIQIRDPVKSDAAAAIEKLAAAGWEVGVLSGDHPSIVGRVCDQLGIHPKNAFGGMSPEDKLAKVTLPSDATTVMIGDGANDAAALAAADVGIAVRGGAEVSLQAAPVFVASGRVGSIVELAEAAVRCRWLIFVTFAVSLSYNLVAVTLSIAGWISPLVAAVLMPISSVSVLSLTLVWPLFRGSSNSQ
ncbi:MAG: heavy metal translocating P-type ATPase metal-binding domain-containing protein [Planctomycetota bacterium]